MSRPSLRWRKQGARAAGGRDRLVRTVGGQVFGLYRQAPLVSAETTAARMTSI
ncbi:MAG: hypothetical protein K1X65_19195 [Caldilineales bacterium]|nr:hypothetical protein [Caldilineales bacterium]